jgi:hypothetical protein
MEIKYIYKKGDKYLAGRLLDYPKYPTQGIDIPDLEKHLLEIYGWIKDGTLEVKEHYGILKVV